MKRKQRSIKRPVRDVACVLAVSLQVTACSSATTSIGPTAGSAIAAGGVLRVVLPTVLASSIAGPDSQTPGLDPQGPTWFDTDELFRCCLLRTLVSHDGTATDQKGAVLRPDLARTLPAVSDDRLTWTFRIKPGIRYAPPLQQTHVTAPDFIRALERTALSPANLNNASFGYYSIIQGYTEFAKKKADTISGLEAPDSLTLVVRLTQPAGDLPYRFTLAYTAPIPPTPKAPSVRLGVATGHEQDYGRFLVATGPYMLEGAERINFSLPPARQTPAIGYSVGRSITLARNPSWERTTDRLRPAFPDRIEITLGGSVQDAASHVDQGKADLAAYSGPPPQAVPAQVRRYQTDVRIGRVYINTRDFIFSVTMNLGIPPFDDIHVRKAASYIIDKQRLLNLSGGTVAGDIAGHIASDSLEDNVLISYDPYRTPGAHGSLELAQQEMRLSRYDPRQDGLCDIPTCRGSVALAFSTEPFATIGGAIQQDLAKIGIDVNVNLLSFSDYFTMLLDPKQRVALGLTTGYGPDYLDASDVIEPNFAGWALDGGNEVGAPPIDDRINECDGAIGSDQTRCWAGMDQYLMEQVVPWIPYVSDNYVQVVGPRVVSYSYDQFAKFPSFDRIALKR